jgi:hypothetical protein
VVCHKRDNPPYVAGNMNFFILTIIIVVVSLIGKNSSGLNQQLSPIVKTHVFKVAGWEISNIFHELSSKPPNTGDASTVLEYFDLTKQANELKGRLERVRVEAPGETGTIQAELDQVYEQQKMICEKVEQVLEKQIRDTLKEQGIYSPWSGLKIFFPPLNFKLAEPPYILIVSPCDRIEKINSIMLQPDLITDEINDIETRTDQLDVSSLVVGIGGLGATYPTFVANDMDLQTTINAAAEEWLHQYLAFRPFGFRYVLDLTGIARNYDIARMNETVASMVSQEIGSRVYNKYYSGLLADNHEATEEGENEPNNTPEAGSGFDFNAEMREIRKQVDVYLARGLVNEAEQYMNEKRDYLAEHGYYIRKLNQAYFAFYGTYAGSPTSVDPIGTKMTQLRNESPSLKAFLDRVSVMTGLQDLETATGP